jgi:CIC family chloride channel protein
MAAVVFALEEVMGDLNAPVLGSVVLASATSWAVLRMLLGNNPLFQAPQYTLVHPLEFGIYALLGIAGGFLSAGFTRLLLWLRRLFARLPRGTRWAQPVAGGLTVGLMGWFVPQVLGVGYGYVGNALNGSMALKLMLLLVVLKVVGVTVSYASGNAGGIFGPSLFLGSMLGGAVGVVAHRLLPGYTASSGAYALVGMGALFAGIVRVPMTSVLMVFEMTRDYAVIVPLMIANLTSYFISARFQHQPIYAALAQQDGIHLPSRGTRAETVHCTVAQVMRRAPRTLPAGSSFQEALRQTRLSSVDAWPVAEGERFLGMVSRAALKKAVTSGKADAPLQTLAAAPRAAHLHADQPLPLALERMSRLHLDLLPVVNRADLHKLEGVVTLRDVLDSYGVNNMEAE